MADELEERPWGDFLVLGAGEGYLVKRIRVSPGHRLSYQRHQSRSEHWYVVAGSGSATLEGTEVRLSPYQSVEVPVGMAHRITNDGSTDLVLVEVQTGDYCGEDDIVRLEDDYGRPSSSGSRPVL